MAWIASSAHGDSTLDTRSPYGRVSEKQAVNVLQPTVSCTTSAPSAPVQSRTRVATSSDV